jgi:hypothetical protein
MLRTEYSDLLEGEDGDIDIEIIVRMSLRVRAPA